MVGSLTPLILMAGQGLLEETAIDVNADVQTQISTYTSQSFIGAIGNFGSFKDTLAKLKSDLVSGPNPNGIPQSSINAFKYSMVELSDIIPLGSGISTEFFNTFINNHIDNLLPNNAEYIAVLQASYGYVQSVNPYINSATNGEDLAAQTFTSMDALMSANITAVNQIASTFGQDLINTGLLFNFDRIDILGTPQALVQTLVNINMLTTLATEFELVGIDVFDLQSAINNNPNLNMNPTVQKRCYDVFKSTTGQKLQDILFVMQFTTTGIETLADLLNVLKIFPNSYSTMRSLNNGVLENIFLPDQSLSPYVSNLETDFTLVLPEDIAKASFAFGCISMQQIKGIRNTTAKILGEQTLNIETNNGLSTINALTQAVPPDVTTFYQTMFANGSAINGTFYLSDAIGSPSGIPHTANLTILNDNFTLWNNVGALNNIIVVMETMTQVVNGSYDDNLGGIPPGLTIPVSQPAAGFWADHTVAINALQIELDSELAALAIAYPAEVANGTAAYLDSINHMLRELATLKEANVQYAITYTIYDAPAGIDGLPGSQQTTLGFAENLHTYSKLTDKGNIPELLEKIVTATRGGEAIVGAMREGRNLQRIADAQVQSDNKIDDTPEIVVPGDIASSTL